MHELDGDGASTAVIMARAMVREAVKRIAAGVEPVSIRKGLEESLAVALEEFAVAAAPAGCYEALTGVAC